MQRGLPAVVIISEQFDNLAKLLLRSRDVPESIAIMIKGNPEYITDDERARIADEVVEQAVKRLTEGHVSRDHH